MRPLPPRPRICAGCGGVDASWQYHERDCLEERPRQFTEKLGGDIDPHIHRTCTRCGFSWRQAAYSGELG